MIPYPEGKGKVHQGFHIAFKSIQSEIEKLVDDAKGLPIILTGHSLGAAVATLVAAFLKKKFGSEIMMYTYGSPLVGDSEFVQYFTKTAPIIHFRIVNNEDIIPMIPPPYSNLRIGLIPAALLNPILWIPATIDPFGKPFNHHGRVVFIRRINMEGVSVDVDRKLPYYIKVPGNLSPSEDRPKAEKLIDWAPFCVTDHFMRRYISILASDLKLAISTYLESAELNKVAAKKTIDYLSGEIAELQRQKDRLEKDLLMSPYPSRPDATGTGNNGSNHQTPTEKLHKVSDALQTKQMELSTQKARLSALSTPGYSKQILKEIISEPMSAALKREMEYQCKAITY